MRSKHLLSRFFIAAICLPQFAHAHGEQIIVLPLAIILLLHLIPIADFFRLKKWGLAAFYLFSQPLVWGVAAAAGFCVSYVAQFVVGGATGAAGLIVGGSIFLVAPFIYWRILLRHG